jgi:hypothetical protein
MTNCLIKFIAAEILFYLRDKRLVIPFELGKMNYFIAIPEGYNEWIYSVGEGF